MRHIQKQRPWASKQRRYEIHINGELYATVGNYNGYSDYRVLIMFRRKYFTEAVTDYEVYKVYPSMFPKDTQ